jgi:hypothetical protein
VEIFSPSWFGKVSVSLSGKRSLDGNAGKCPTTGLQNELSDDKIGGPNNGQKSEQWH